MGRGGAFENAFVLFVLQSIRILARSEDLAERGRVRKNHSGNANRTEMGRGMNGKGMEHGSATFLPLPFIPLPSPPEVLDCGSAALRSLRLINCRISLQSAIVSSLHDAGSRSAKAPESTAFSAREKLCPGAAALRQDTLTFVTLAGTNWPRSSTGWTGLRKRCACSLKPSSWLAA